MSFVFDYSYDLLAIQSFLTTVSHWSYKHTQCLHTWNFLFFIIGSLVLCMWLWIVSMCDRVASLCKWKWTFFVYKHTLYLCANTDSATCEYGLLISCSSEMWIIYAWVLKIVTIWTSLVLEDGPALCMIMELAQVCYTGASSAMSLCTVETWMTSHCVDEDGPSLHMPSSILLTYMLPFLTYDYGIAMFIKMGRSRRIWTCFKHGHVNSWCWKVPKTRSSLVRLASLP